MQYRYLLHYLFFLGFVSFCSIAKADNTIFLRCSDDVFDPAGDQWTRTFDIQFSSDDANSLVITETGRDGSTKSYNGSRTETAYSGSTFVEMTLVSSITRKINISRLTGEYEIKDVETDMFNQSQRDGFYRESGKCIKYDKPKTLF